MAKKGFKEWLRKKVVALKRSPQTIGLIAYIIAFLYYALNLTSFSDTTAKIQGPNMGLYGFMTMLFSILGLVCYLNAFPKRKKSVKPMVALMFLMAAVVFVCDVLYGNLIHQAVFRPDNPIIITQSTLYISKAYSVLGVHRILLIIATALTALLPVIKLLLKKINTSVKIEGYDDMALDLSKE